MSPSSATQQPPPPPYPAAPSTQALGAVPPSGNPSTQVLPKVAPAAEPTPTAAPPPPAVAVPRPTGPLDFVPGLPGVGSIVAAKERTPRDRATMIGLGLVGAAVVLLQIGLLLGFGGPGSLWTTVPLWSGFATVSSLLGLLAFAGRHPRREQLRNDRAWKLSAAGLTGLALFWVLVVLPLASTDRGFVLTAALACLGIALWIAPGRKAGTV